MWYVFHPGVSLGHEPHVAMAALASYFQAGCSQATVPSALTGSMVVQQVLAVGQKFLHVHQVAHMHHLLALAGEAADTPGAAFLRVSSLSLLLYWHHTHCLHHQPCNARVQVSQTYCFCQQTNAFCFLLIDTNCCVFALAALVGACARGAAGSATIQISCKVGAAVVHLQGTCHLLLLQAVV